MKLIVLSLIISTLVYCGRLSTRLNEHKKDENSSLYKHSLLADHINDYCKSEFLAEGNWCFQD